MHSFETPNHHAGTKRLNRGPSGSPPGDETVFLTNEIIPKQRARHPAPDKQGMANMQFFFDLIWTQSCSRYLASMGHQEAEL